MAWLAKVRYYTSENLLRTIYYALLESHMRYECQIWGQTSSQLTNEIAILQNKALRIITFSDRNTPADPLFKQLKILKFDQMIQMDNCLLALKSHQQKSP